MKILHASNVSGNPTWFPILGRIVQSIMPVSRDDKEVLIHALV